MSALAVHELRVDLGGRPVLLGIDLDLRPGEVTAVIGPNGAGKSTLLACLAGLLKSSQGRVTLDGQPVTALPPRDRARRIGFLPQTPEIAWAVDVETLVGLGRLPYQSALAGGLTAEDRAAVEWAMAETGVEDFRTRAANTLSGGERGRALIARALAGRPEWLLADEPLAGLDPGHQFDACALFRRMAGEGQGVVVTLHDLSLASRLADRVIVLNQGRIAADGPPAEALTAAMLAEVYAVEARVELRAGGLAVDLIGRHPS